jgi:hypothetical protein
MSWKTTSFNSLLYRDGIPGWAFSVEKSRKNYTDVDVYSWRNDDDLAHDYVFEITLSDSLWASASRLPRRLRHGSDAYVHSTSHCNSESDTVVAAFDSVLAAATKKGKPLQDRDVVLALSQAVRSLDYVTTKDDRSLPASQVIAARGGDCDDRASLMCAWLRNRSVPARVVLVASVECPDLLPKAPPSTAMHVIVEYQDECGVWEQCDPGFTLNAVAPGYVRIGDGEDIADVAPKWDLEGSGTIESGAVKETKRSEATRASRKTRMANLAFVIQPTKPTLATQTCCGPCK